MTNTPGNGWPGGPPPQGPGSTPPGWGSQTQGPGSTPPGWGSQPWNTSGQPNPAQYPGQGQYPGQRQYPQQPGGQQQQPPGQPQQPGGPAPGFDPTRRLGEAPPRSVSIDEFRPPTNRTPLLITIAALVTLALVVLGGLYIRNQPIQPTPSPSPSQTTPAGPGQPFTTPNGQQNGRWEILDQQWTDEGLQLQLRIHSDKGPITFSFMAFTNASTQIVEPTSSPNSPDIRTGTASAARPVTGYVFFPMTRGDATIILATGSGRQMSALPVKG